MLEERISELKAIIAGNDGRNAADRRFAHAVDDLISAVYDDIGEIKQLSTRALFDLFIIKVLYVGRHSRHADVVDYLGQLLDTYLYASQLYRTGRDGKPRALYFSDVLDEQKASEFFDNRFDAYRTYADSALFMSGVFPSSVRPPRASSSMMSSASASRIDGDYYVTTGKTMYRMAAMDSGAPPSREPETLLKLAEHFEVYVEALNEMSARYITGVDMDAVADKMLDNFNRYRETGENSSLENARRYASLLRFDQAHFPSLFQRDPN